MSQEIEGLLGDLTEAIARVLVRYGITAEEFLSVARRSYILATARLVTPRGKTANVTRISSATGLSRKEITTILRGSALSGGNKNSVLRKRALCVARAWLTDRRFLNETRRPTLLSVGPGGTFHRLVQLYGGGESASSILRVLERMGIVELAQGRARLIRDTATPFDRKRSLRRVGRQITDAIRAIDQHLQDPTVSPQSRYCEFSDLTADEIALFRKMYSGRISALIESIDGWVETQRRLRSGSQIKSPKRGRLSLGVYLSTED